MSEPTIEDIQRRLDGLYISNKDQYYEHLKMVKEIGYKVFRNSAGNHIIKANPDYIYEAFGGAFGKIFGGD